MKRIRYMSIKDFVDAGLLFEINRTILHPLGLAMGVTENTDGSMYLSGIWDYRDDPEGMIYGEDLFNEGLAKYEKFMNEYGSRKLSERRELLGFVHQEREK